ncbi:MAG: CCA tRNA nucleotidyltransferase [Armatimonadota bacterium]|nr:CCA tRNA nucleotidyltransferase [Armatimonadota bacterium]MDR7438423.1 CCA tRNA nucleotidyltransferase [Armatimonadota bacterium]MDR7567753.1 CCA tRNA nucleotidyltransferase [Armatimonadota bacterium]MDR7601267.1 CCA tRNA nucleotidyltransferase [Armatimonadota bacterium]
MVRRLREAGYEAYWAGGCVRDLLLGRTPKDYDVATSARPEEVLRLLPDAIPVGAAFGVVRVRVGEHWIEVATFRTEGPYLDGRHPAEVHYASAREDVLRRDFTINGLLLDPLTGKLIDWVNGQRDLAERRIRTIGDPQQRFQEDRLRMLRAVRLAVELDFAIEPETFAAIRSLADRIRTTSWERIRDELTRILSSPRRAHGLRLLDASGLLAHILPEVAAMKGVPQPLKYHPEGDVFEHTVRVLEALRTPTVTLAWGALLHDVGKPLTLTWDGRARFPGHDRVGAEVAREICSRLRLSHQETERIVTLVRDHMRLSDLPRMREGKRRLFFARPDFEELLELYRADCVASNGDLTTYEWILTRCQELRPEDINPPRLLTGRDLIALGLTPGPIFRELLAAVRDAQLEGRVHSQREALELVRELLRAQEKPHPGSNSPSEPPGEVRTVP